MVTLILSYRDSCIAGVLTWGSSAELQCPVFQDRAMCQLIASDNDGFHLQSETVRLIYKISPPSSKLRMFAVDQLLWHGQFEPETETGTNNYTHQIGAAEIMAMEDFNRDLWERLLEYGGCGYGDPAKKGSRYLKVLDYGTWGLDSS